MDTVLITGGSVVIVSSAVGRVGSPGEYVDYAGSKAAVDTLAIGLAKELGPDGVRVNSMMRRRARPIRVDSC